MSPNRTKKLQAVTEEAGYAPAEVAKAQAELALVPVDEAGDPTALVQLAQRALEQANSISEARDVRDYADAIRFLMRRRKLGIESENEAAVVVFGAERKMGQMLRDLKADGTIDARGRYADETRKPQLLLDIVQKDDSARWQKLARATDEQWAYLVDALRQSGRRIAATNVYAEVDQLVPRQAGHKPPKDHPVRDREAEYQAELDRELVLPEQMVGEKPINPWVDPWARMQAAAEELFDAMSHGWPLPTDAGLPLGAATERVAKVAVAFHRRVEELAK